MKAAMDGPIAMTSSDACVPGKPTQHKGENEKDADLVAIDESFHDDFLLLVFRLTMLCVVVSGARKTVLIPPARTQRAPLLPTRSLTDVIEPSA